MPTNVTVDSVLDELATPVLRLDSHGRITDANAALAAWLGISRRRLPGLGATALERDGEQLAAALAHATDRVLRLRRVGLALPGQEPLRFADLWLTPAEPGWWLEIHAVDEFPGGAPADLLPAALSASLKGLAHELRNPLVGIKGAAQLLARRLDGPGRELTAIIESEVARSAKGGKGLRARTVADSFATGTDGLPGRAGRAAGCYKLRTFWALDQIAGASPLDDAPVVSP